MHTETVFDGHLLKKMEVLKLQMVQFRQEHARLETGSTERVALEVTIASLIIDYCKLQRELIRQYLR